MFTSLVNAFGDHYLHEINGGTFNIQGSEAFYQSYFSDQLFNKQTFYLIVGTDSGLLVDYILNGQIDKESQYLFVELQSVLEHMSSRDQPLPPNINVVTFENWQSMADCKKMVAYFLMGKTRLMRSVAVVDGFCGQYRELSDQVEQGFFQAQWKVGVSFAGFSFIDQQLKNISENNIPARCLKNHCRGMSAIILAGGPSLEAMLPWIKENQAHFVIVAVSRISQRLLDLGLIPDFIVAIDPTDKMFDVSKAMLKFSDGPIFVNADYVSSKLLGQWSGKHVYLGNRIPWDLSYDQDNIPVQGPTVTNAAFSFVMELGVERIYLAGVDLCYSREGYSHTKGNVEWAQGPNLGFSGRPVELNDGTMGETESGFFAAIETLAKQAHIALEKGCRTMNLSPRAAKIDNVESITINHVDLCTDHIDKKSITLPMFSDNELKQRCEKDLQEIENACSQLKQMMDLAKAALKLNKNLTHQNAGKIQKLEDAITAHYHLLQVVKLNNYKAFASLCDVELKDKLDPEYIKRASYDFFTAIFSGCLDFRKKLNTCMQRIQSRKMELTTMPDFDLLATQWVHDGHFARAHKWPAIPSLDLVRKTYQQQFEAKPVSKQNNYADLAYLRNIQHKLYHLYRAKDKTMLAMMIEHLERSQADTAQALGSLAKGYQAELNDDFDCAVSFYYDAAKGPFQEVCLSHLASLLMELRDIDNAWLTLQCLSDIAPGYLPQYAHLCHLLGKQKEAICAYETYLSQAPKDSLVRTKYQKMLLDA